MLGTQLINIYIYLYLMSPGESGLVVNRMCRIKFQSCVCFTDVSDKSAVCGSQHTLFLLFLLL